jgi:WD40 repeat protein
MYNENLLSLIFKSFTLSKRYELLTKTSNTILTKRILRSLNYKAIFQSMGKKLRIYKYRKSIHSLIKLSDDYLLFASDEELKIFHIKSGKFRKTNVRDDNISSLIMLANGLMASCYSNQAKIKIWEFIGKGNFKLLRTIEFEGYSSIHLFLLTLNGNLACTANNRNNDCVLISDKKNYYNCAFVMKELECSICSMAELASGLFATGDSSNNIEIWNFIDKFNTTKLLLGHTG